MEKDVAQSATPSARQQIQDSFELNHVFLGFYGNDASFLQVHIYAMYIYIYMLVFAFEVNCQYFYYIEEEKFCVVISLRGMSAPHLAILATICDLFITYKKKHIYTYMHINI